MAVAPIADAWVKKFRRADRIVFAYI